MENGGSRIEKCMHLFYIMSQFISKHNLFKKKIKIKTELSASKWMSTATIAIF